jgi:RimJ/RimL family protein N-acetyltransferase
MPAIVLDASMPGALVSAGERVALRSVESEDVAFTQRNFANPELRYPLGQPLRTRTEMADEDSESDSDGFLVTREADPVPGTPDEEVERVGTVHVVDADWRRPELGYWIVPEAQGEGYGTEGVSLAIDYVFRTYDHPGVEARVFDFNDASIGLLESLGFEREGRLRNRRFVDGAYRDTLWYGLMRADWDGCND